MILSNIIVRVLIGYIFFSSSVMGSLSENPSHNSGRLQEQVALEDIFGWGLM